MNEEEQYFFDLMGYLVIDDVLTAEDLAELNRLIDQYDFWRDPAEYEVPVGAVSGAANEVRVGSTYQWHDVFRRLVTHPRITPYLLTLVGPTVRFDHDYLVLTRPGAETLPIEGGGEPYDDTAVYHFQNGRMFNGVVAVSFALTDSEQDDGGLVVVPGSHKSNYPLPDEWRDAGEARPWLRSVNCKAGSAVVFTEALAHGSAPWGAEGERRTVFMKYAPGAMSATRSYPRPDDVPHAAWTEQQRSMLEPPYFQNRSFVTTATEGTT